MARAELRFGTVVSVSGRDAMVRFPGIADPVPVRCVEGVPQPGRKVGCWQTAQRLYYLGGGVAEDGIPRFGAGGSLLSPSSGPDASWVVLGASGRGVLLRAGAHEVQAVYSGGGTSGYVGTNRPTRPEHPANAFVTKGYVDAVKAAAAAATSFADFQARIAAL